MTTTMKGLLKGLRYISQIFEADDDEPEMQIGHPTDVKHVAHIGLDGPSSNSPSWMNGFENKSAPLNFPTHLDVPDIPKPRRHPSMDVSSPSGTEYDDLKQSRRRHSASGSINSGSNESPDRPKTSRRHHSKSGVEEGESVSKTTRKKKSSKGSTSSSGEGSRRGGSTRTRKSHQSSNSDVPPYPDTVSGS